MKLRTPFSVIKNALSDIRVMHDFNYEIPAETREEFWKEECEVHPTSSTCKVYDDWSNKDLMDPLDPALQNTAVTGVKPLLTLAIFAGVGSFFLGALLTAIRRGMKEEGWFKFKQEKDEQD